MAECLNILKGEKKNFHYHTCTVVHDVLLHLPNNTCIQVFIVLRPYLRL